MERQKIFWVVLAVSALVVVVLVVGVVLLRPRAAAMASAQQTASPLSESGAQIYEYQREPAASTQPQQNGGSETMHFYIGEGEQSGQQTQQQATSPQGTPEAAQQGTPQESQQPATQPAKSQPAATAKPAPSKTQPAVKQQKITEYWIQAGSYKSQSKAEELAALLEGKGLGGRVFSSTQKSGTFYRVRIGPYTTKGEAEKFLAIVKQLQGMESSYIAQVPSTRSSVN